MSQFQMITDKTLHELSLRIIPQLSSGKHKGQAGRVGIVGGSMEYTGAPYFAGISALKVGADLCHIFCMKEAAPVIKSYSPELIVHPLLDDPKAIALIQPWLERLHVVVIGPGLGRDATTISTVTHLIHVCRTLGKPLVIDADGLYIVTKNPQVIQNYPGVILTPNAIEFSRLIEVNDTYESYDFNAEKVMDKCREFGEQCVILRKGREDEMFDLFRMAKCDSFGSGRRCGGQGDMLAGSLAVFYCWALQNTKVTPELNAFLACFLACRLTRICNMQAFEKHGRSMLCSDMINEIGDVFQKEFEIKI